MKVAVQMNVWTANLAGTRLTPRCPGCNHTLDLHQPDENDPARLLATCGRCSRWYCLMDSKVDSAAILVAELPGEAVAEAACQPKVMRKA